MSAATTESLAASVNQAFGDLESEVASLGENLSKLEDELTNLSKLTIVDPKSDVAAQSADSKDSKYDDYMDEKQRLAREEPADAKGSIFEFNRRLSEEPADAKGSIFEFNRRLSETPDIGDEEDSLSDIYDNDSEEKYPANSAGARASGRRRSNGAGEFSGAGENLVLVGGTFEADAAVHEHLVGSLEQLVGAGVVGGGVVGSLESSVLRKIHAAGESIQGGVAKVEAALTTRLQNIVDLKELIAGAMRKSLDVIKESSEKGSAASRNMEVIKGVWQELDRELDSQLKALEKALRVHVAPAKGELLSLLKKNKSFTALADRLGTTYGDENASDRLALTFTNLSQLQLASVQVRDALKTLKMSLDQYKSLKSASALQSELAKVLKKTSHPSTDELSKVIKAMDILKKNQHRHNDIVAALKSSNGVRGSGDVEGGDLSTGIGRVTRGNSKSTLKKRVNTYERTIREVFQNFISQLNSNFKEIRASVDVASEQIGSLIAYDDNLRLFIDIFEGLRTDLNDKKLFYALIELDVTMSGRELKNRFSSNLDRLIESLEVLKEQRYLGSIRSQLKSVKENIAIYSDSVKNIRESEEGSKTGSLEFTWSDKLVDPSLPAATANLLKDTIVKLKFFGNLSTLKDNLSRVHKDQAIYSKDYSEVIGKSIGAKITDLEKEYTEAVDRLNDKERGRGWLLEDYNRNAPADQKIPRGLVETVYKLQYDAKKGLYQTVEALDLYLMNFTTELSGNIDALRDLNEMLKQTELISAWFDADSDAAINDMAALLQADVDNNTAIAITSGFFQGDHRNRLLPIAFTGKAIREALEKSKRAVESVASLKNIISMFMSVGDKFGSVKLSSKSYMHASTMYKNLVKYIWVSGFTMGYGTGGGNVDTKITSEKKDKGSYDIETGDRESFFSMRPTSVSHPLGLLGEWESTLQTNIKLVKDGMPAEITATLVAAGAASLDVVDAAGNVLGTFTTSAQLDTVYRTLRGTQSFDDVIIQGVTDLNDNVSLGAGGAQLAANVSSALIAQYVTTWGRPAARAPAAGRANPIRVFTVPQLVAIWHSVKTVEEGLTKRDVFATEDKYFVMALKAIAAKVLTVVETSHMLNQPHTVTSMIAAPVRTIIGGSEVKVVDEAVELYIRLPLLVEFYKHVFDNGNDSYKKNRHANDDTETIAFIPEIGSVWSGLIQCVFDESKQINNGVYSIENMRRIVHEINGIYNRFKSAGNGKVVREACLALVSEINRRYGVLKRKDLNSFYQVKQKYSNNMDSLPQSAVDFDILNDSEEFDGSAPSSKFVEDSLSKQSGENKITKSDISLVKTFRDNIHNEFYNRNNFAALQTNSFVERINHYRSEISRADSQERKLELVMKAIDESSNVNSQNIETSVMYHELVRFPTNVLWNEYVRVNKVSYSLLKFFLATEINKIRSIESGVRDVRNAYDAVIDVLGGIDFTAETYQDVVARLNTPARVHALSHTGLNGLPGAAAPTGADTLIATTVAADAALPAGSDSDFYRLARLLVTCLKAVNDAAKSAIAATPALIPLAYDMGTFSTTMIDFLDGFVSTARQYNATVNAAGIATDLSLKNSMILDVANALTIECGTAGIGGDVTLASVAAATGHQLADGDLLKVKFINKNKFMLDYSGLQNMLEGGVEYVKYTISRFRNQIPANQIAVDEKAISEIESTLLNKIVYAEDTTNSGIGEILNLEAINAYISQCTKDLETANNLLDGTAARTRAAALAINTPYHLSRISCDRTQLIARVVAGFGDAILQIPGGGGVASWQPLSVLAAANPVINDVFRTYDSRQRVWVRLDQIPAPAVGAAGPAPMDIALNQYVWNTDILPAGAVNPSFQTSVLIRFNNLLARYVNVFYDVSAKKFYKNLVTNFAKSQNSAVFGGNGLLDIFAPTVTALTPAAGSYVSSANNEIITTSLGHVIKVLLSRNASKQTTVKQFAVDDISDVSINMIEKYKAFLPFFYQAFGEFVAVGKHYKAIFDNTNRLLVNGAVPDTPITATVGGVVAQPLPATSFYGEEDYELNTLAARLVVGNENIYSRTSAHLTNLVEAAHAIREDIRAVMVEMEYSTNFFETKSDFMKMHFNTNGNLPLGPMSILASIDTPSMNDQSIIPSATMANAQVKWSYGASPILYRVSGKVDLNSFKWVKESVVAYNNSALAVNKVDASKLEAFVSGIVSSIVSRRKVDFVRTLTHVHLLADSPDNDVVTMTAMDARAAAAGIATTPVAMVTSRFSQMSPVDIVNLVENSNLNAGKAEISNGLVALAAAVPSLDRKAARALNLLDLNIAPIDVHALMREIPGINLYNYAFTFDSMVKNDVANFDIASNARPATGAEIMSTLLQDPYYARKAIDPNGAIAAALPVGVLEADAPLACTSTVTRMVQAMRGPIQCQVNPITQKTMQFEVPKFVKDQIADKCDNAFDREHARFNSKIFRSTMFVANVQRFMLQKIKMESERVNSRVVKSNGVLNRRITSYDTAAPGNVYNANEFDYVAI